MLHLALETWEKLEQTSHLWHVSPSNVLKAVGLSLFGYTIIRFGLHKIWSKLVNNSKEKAEKILKATAIIKKSKGSDEAIKNIQQELGVNVQNAVTKVVNESKKNKKNVI